MIEYITAKKALSASWLKTPILLSDMKAFAEHFSAYLSGAKTGETEEFHKNVIKNFLVNTFYHGEYNVNTNGREDLVIFNGKGADTKPAVIIEAKSPTNTAEMFSDKNENCKALQECVYYFMQEAVTAGNREIQHIIITNYDDWYIFDARDFVFFLEDKAFVEDFKKFESKQLLLTKTSDFYSELAKPEIEKWRASKNICVTHFAPKDFFFQDLTPNPSPSRRGENVGEEEKSEIEKYNALRALYKVLSPEHLLRKNFANDANSLDQNFYEELLYIMGLEEVKSGGKKIIQRRKEGERVKASLIESAMYELEETILNEYKRFETAMNLVITWINRLLFLKLLESQQLNYQNGNKAYRFLTIEKIPTFSALNDLFFKVLAKKEGERDAELGKKFSCVPYLNSMLFETSVEEIQARLMIRAIQHRPFPLYAQTVLKTQFGVRRTGEIDNLEYILSFLDAYNFSSESAEGITTDTKTLINASVLGLIFEKINGYKDGSFFTPSFITEYMAKEAIERSVIEKFNSAKGWKCKTIAEIEDEIEDRAEANEIFNTIRVLDPAVGSGHFLVSALNRLLFVKWQLGILCDKRGKRIKKRDWTMSLENDEISLTDEDGEAFEYKAQNEESQRVQETLFREKKSLIENCLFGVDINPASVYICRLRLWIELLKNAYYKMDGVKTGEVASLETLPNIDINIKCGNSLISKYRVEVGASAFLRNEKDSTKDKEITQLIKEYRAAVAVYKNDSDKFHKRGVDETIQKLKAKLGEVAQLSLFDIDENKEKEIQHYYKNSLEWMLEFPEVLDDSGRFLGFDVVIGNPPYIKEYTHRAAFDGFRETSDYYTGKMDLWYGFACRALDLVKSHGIVSFIAQNNWTTSKGASIMRKKVVENARIIALIDFLDFKVFDRADIQTMIMIFECDRDTDDYAIDYRTALSGAEMGDIKDLYAKKENVHCQYFSPVLFREKYRDKLLTFSIYEDLLAKIAGGKEHLIEKEATNGIHTHFDCVDNKIHEKFPDLPVGKGIFVLSDEELGAKKHFQETEIAQGIVFPQDFLDNNGVKKLGAPFSKGDCVFGLTKEKIDNLNLSESEKMLVKPYFTSSQIHRYFVDPNNSKWLIYTDSSFKDPDSMNPYPHLKAHLDSVRKAITSDNKPYGLHRAREEHFFKGEKIIVQRKCVGRPLFAYNDFDCYVSAMYYVIQTSRWNMKFLTGVLNSKLVAFWLRYRGKMQGSNYQVDKEPLLNIPIPSATTKEQKDLQKKIIDLVDEILALKQANSTADTSEIERKIDEAVYALYGLTEDEIATVDGR